MKKIKFLLYAVLCLNLVELNAQQDLSKLSWSKVANSMPEEWYSTEQAVQIADTVLAYQTEIGGWTKNTGFHKKINQKEMAKVRKSGIGATFDNGATVTEMRYLAKIYKFHEDAKDDEYAYSDRDSSVKLYSTNLVETAKAGQALPFKNVDEFKDYVMKKMNPKFIDNAGWDAKVEWEIEDPELFEQSKENPWAKDYVLIANLKSGVDEKEYKDVEFGYVKFVYRVEATDDTNYVYLEKAKEAFAKINELRKAQGLKELTWSDDVYNSLALPKANQISRQYDSTGFVARREEDPATVATKWFNSGLRELLLDPNVTEGAVAAVVNGDGYYYWAYNYK